MDVLVLPISEQTPVSVLHGLDLEVLGPFSLLVEGLPWVPDRPTLGSRFFSGLCQVPVNKMVSGGFPRVFRFPQLLL